MTGDNTTPAAQPPDDDEAEVDAIAAVARSLKGLAPDTRRRVIEWAAGKYGASIESTRAPGAGTPAGGRARAAPAGTTRTVAAPSRTAGRRKAGSLSFDKSLDLRPKGCQSFADFTNAKSPKSMHEQNVVAVYWLTRVAGHDAATVDQVYSCYKDRAWRVPSNLRNRLAVTASTKGWIDSANMESLKVTVGGENYVEHDLPAKADA